MKYLSLFSGIGGFELGIQRAYDNQLASGGTEAEPSEPNEDMRQVRQREAVSEMPRSSRRVGDVDRSVQLHAGGGSAPFCIGYSEIDKYAIKVYERQFNGHTNFGDATTIDSGRLPDFDLLVGGFPCQAFSIAGKRAGFGDTRGTLFFDIARLLKDKRPRHLVLENVKGLLNHDGGKTFQTILGVLADLGYRIEWQVLNSKDFGVPQNRERVYIVGHLRGECGRKVFPIYGNDGASTQILGRVEVKGHDYLKRVYSSDGASPTIPTKTGGGHIPKTMVRSAATRTRTYADQPEALEIRKDEVSNTLNSVPKDYYAVDMTLKEKNGYKIRKDNQASTIDANYSKGIARQERPAVLEEARIRRLTPRECERLQGFPDDFTKFGVGDEPISDTQRYKMCGNAVTVNVVQAVMEGLFNEV